MIKSIFEFVKGVGPNTQEKLWKLGLTCWEDVIQSPSKPSGISERQWINLKKFLPLTQTGINTRNWGELQAMIDRKYHWGLIPQFWDNIAYLDIETTGLNPKYHQITTIAVFDGKKVNDFIANDNLHEFPLFIKKYPAICTFFGKGFDIPFIEKTMKFKMDHVHFDVCFLFRKVGIRGGLKKIERKFDLSRGNLAGIDGSTAVYLWLEYQKTKNIKFLETLLAYNNEDVLNLPILLANAYNMIIQNKYSTNDLLEIPKYDVSNPNKPDPAVLRHILA